MARDTLRLEDPSTLFETHALGTIRWEKLSGQNYAHIVLAADGETGQIRAEPEAVLGTYGRLGKSRWKRNY